MIRMRRDKDYTVYSGTKEELILAGVAKREQFPIGEDRVRTNRPDRSLGTGRDASGESSIWRTYREGNGEYSIVYYPSEDPAKVAPESDLDHGEITSFGGERWTIYRGTKQQLIKACLATPSMFPYRGGWASGSEAVSPQQASWRLYRGHDGRWYLIRYHEPLELDPELREAKRARLITLLSRCLQQPDDHQQ